MDNLITLIFDDSSMDSLSSSSSTTLTNSSSSIESKKRKRSYVVKEPVAKKPKVPTMLPSKSVIESMDIKSLNSLITSLAEEHNFLAVEDLHKLGYYPTSKALEIIVEIGNFSLFKTLTRDSNKQSVLQRMKKNVISNILTKAVLYNRPEVIEYINCHYPFSLNHEKTQFMMGLAQERGNFELYSQISAINDSHLKLSRELYL